jgi:predicted dehydrogenase
MLECAHQHPKQLSLIDHELRFLPHFNKLREVIHNEDLFGKILRIELDHILEMNSTNPWRLVNLSKQMKHSLFNRETQMPSYSLSWWSDESSGGGMLGAIGSHQFDLVSWFLKDRISELNARLETLIKERPTAPNESPHSFQIILKFNTL